MTSERIRELLEAEPFTPFSVHLVDHHSIHIGDPGTAWLEDDGRTLVAQTLVRRTLLVETVDIIAVARLLVRVPTALAELPEKEALPAPPQAEPVAPPKTRVLFICTRNSVRSQMAEAWLRHLGEARVEAQSAGYEPGELHPLAIEAMREVGIDISAQKPKSIFDVYRSGAIFAFTISVCDESAEKPPVFPGQTERLHWSFPDPLADSDHSDAAVLSRMRSVRDALRERIETWLRDTIPRTERSGTPK